MLSFILLMGAVPVTTFAETGTPSESLETVDLDADDVTTLDINEGVKKFKYGEYDRLEIEVSYPAGVSILIKNNQTTRSKYENKIIRIPDEIRGKKVVVLNGIEGETIFPIHGLDLSLAKHLKAIGDNSFNNSSKSGYFEIKDSDSLQVIGKEAVGKKYVNSSLEKLVLKNLTNLELVQEKAFYDCRYKNLEIINLPKLKYIDRHAFSFSDIDKIDLKGAPNLKYIGYRAFGYNKIYDGYLDLRYLKNLEYVDTAAFLSRDANIRNGIVLPYVSNTKNIPTSLAITTSSFFCRSNVTFKFASKNPGDNLPDELNNKKPENFYCYVYLFSKDHLNNLIDKYTNWTDPINKNEWQFKEWNITGVDPTAPTTALTPYDVSCTGTWELLFNKENLKKALDAANAKRQDVVVSTDGSELPFTKKWVTEADKNTFDAAITAAQSVFDNENIEGDTLEARQKVVDDATAALKEATEKYKPQEGKLNYDKNPTYAQPQGAHKVTFEKGEGIESLTEENTFYYVKYNTALPAAQFPKATAQAGFGTKIFWDPAQDTVITSDQAFTASARAVDKGALQAKITEAKGLLQNDTTSDPAVALNTKVNEAKALITAIDNGTERNQDNVDAKVTELESAIQALKDLNTKKDAAKTQIGNIDGLKSGEITTLQGEVDAAKNTDAVDAIIAKAQAQAQTNKAVAEAKNLVTAAEQAKTQEAYDTAKAKVDALSEDADKTELDGRLAEVEKYIKAENAVNALRQKPIADVTESDINNAQRLIDNVKQEWRQNLIDELNIVRTDKAANDKLTEAKNLVTAAEQAKTQAAYDTAKAKVDGLPNGQEKTDLLRRLAEVEKYIKADDALKTLERKSISDVTQREIDEAEALINNVKPEWKQDLTNRLTTLKTNKQNQAAEDALAQAKQEAKDKINALQNLNDQEKAPFITRVDNATTIDQINEAVLDAQKADAKKKVAGMNNLSPTDKQNANDAIDQANDETGINNAVEEAQNKNDQAAALAQAKQEAKNKINALQNLSEEEKAPFITRVDNATTTDQINEAVLDAQKADAKKKVAEMPNLTDDQRDQANNAIDGAQNNDQINDAVTEAQNQNNANQSLAQAKEAARAKINALDKLTQEEKQVFLDRVDQAQTKADVDAIVLEAQKANAKKKIAQMPNLSDDERRETDQAIDNARTEDEINDAVENAGRRVEPTPSYPRYDYNPFWNIYFGSTTNKTTTTPQPQKKIVIKLQTKLVIGSKEMIKAVDDVEQKVMMDIAPFIDSNRTMLPIRFVAEALGFKVEWDDPSRTVILTDKDNVVRIPVDTNKIIVNGNKYESDVKPVLRNNRTMLPIGNIARALGLKDGTDIIWDAATRTVVIKREIEK